MLPPPPTQPPFSTADAAGPPWFAPAVLLATAGGLGRVPFAPGTFGALLGLPLALVTGAGAARRRGEV